MQAPGPTQQHAMNRPEGAFVRFFRQAPFGGRSIVHEAGQHVNTKPHGATGATNSSAAHLCWD